MYKDKEDGNDDEMNEEGMPSLLSIYHLLCPHERTLSSRQNKQKILLTYKLYLVADGPHFMTYCF